MGSTMSALESTEMLMFGKFSQNYLTIYRLLLLLRVKFSVCMAACLPLLIPLIKLDNSIEFKKCLKRAQCAIYSGQIPTIVVDGVFPQEELVTHSVRTSLSNLITQIT